MRFLVGASGRSEIVRPRLRWPALVRGPSASPLCVVKTLRRLRFSHRCQSVSSTVAPQDIVWG
jgi:hypothetical protein